MTSKDIEHFRPKIEEILQDCSERNWDGYNADPVLQESTQIIYEILEVLPSISIILEPYIEPLPDGRIALEWIKGDNIARFVISSSLQKPGELCCNALLKDSKDKSYSALCISLPFDSAIRVCEVFLLEFFRKDN